MTQHIVKSFQEELDSLSAQIAQMGGLTEAQLSAAIEAVTRRDQQLAERTILEDQRIDALESEIEAHAVRMIALRQPMATDLREAIAAIKISIDLERIGDLAKNIAKRLSKAGIVEHFNHKHGIFTLTRLANGDCLYLDRKTRLCTVYAKRPDTCRNHPRIGPRPGYCAYRSKTAG